MNVMKLLWKKAVDVKNVCVIMVTQANRRALLATTTVAVVLFSQSAFALPTADLNSTLTSGQTFLQNIGKFLVIAAGLAGSYFIFSGFMAWRKSSGDAGGQVEAKEIFIPIVVGGLLVAFTAVVSATSSTFGYTNTNLGF